MWWIYLASMSLSVLFIGFGFLSYFYDFMVDKFNKSATILGRVKIWSLGIQAFVSNPIFGYGRKAYVNGGISVEITHYHNQYLDLLCIGGIILFVIWFSIVKLASDSMDDVNCDYRIKNVLLFAALAYGILYLMEAQRTDVLVFAFFALAYHCKSLHIELKAVPKKDNKSKKYLLDLQHF